MRRRGRVWLAVVAAALALPLCGALGVWLWLRHLRDAWTEASPSPVTVAETSVQERRRLAPRYRRLQEAARAGRAAEVSFGSEELDALIASAEELSGLRGKVSLSLDGETVVARVSLPLSEVPLASGRYLNGEFRLRVSVSSGHPEVEVLEGRTSGGTPYPAWMVRRVNAALSRPEARERLARALRGRVEALEVSDGRVMVRTR